MLDCDWSSDVCSSDLTACGTCVEQCPMGALDLDQCYAVADRERCIACFCCQEMCPEKAIALR
jgi:ferredoxin